jgi:hypothetical protein
MTAAVLALAGCGGGESASGDVESTAEEYVHAFATGDPARACELLTPLARQRFVQRARAAVGAADCGGAVRRLRAAAGPAAMNALGEARVSDVKVAGSRATATLTSGSGLRVVRFVKRGGEWRLADVPGAQ